MADRQWLSSRLHRLAELRKLIELKERRARAVLLKRQSEAAELDRTRMRQSVLVDECQAALQELISFRQRAGVHTAQNLQAIDERRRWLQSDLEKEHYYLGVADSDCRVAQGQLSAARRLCLQYRERLHRIDADHAELRRYDRLRQQVTVDEQLEDTLRTIPVHG